MLTIPAHTTTARAETDSEELSLGLLPYISTPRLIKTFLPLKQYLEKTLQRPVRLETAPNFREYLKRMSQGEYDFYHTAPHFAAYAESQFGHRRLSRYKRQLDGSILVRADSNIMRIGDLEGKIIAMPGRLAVISMLGEVYLRDNKLIPGRNIKLHHAESHGNAILSVSKGSADAAVVSAGVFERMPREVKSKLKIMTKTQQIPHVMFMAKNSMPDALYNDIRNAMLAFTVNSHGKQFFKESKRHDMGAITDQDMQALQPFVKMLKEELR